MMKYITNKMNRDSCKVTAEVGFGAHLLNIPWAVNQY